MPINSDLTLNISGIYGEHSLNGKSLAWLVEHRSYWVIETLIPMCRHQWQIEAVDAAMELQKGRGERPYDRAAMLKTKALLEQLVGGINDG